MATNWGRTPVTNADHRARTQMTYLVDTDDGPEERIDRRPQGRVERFVSPDGDVMSIQVFGAGDPRQIETERRQRDQLHRKGFIEHAKCPLRSGTRGSSDRTAREFAKMPEHLLAECKGEIRPMKRIDGLLYADKGCPHIEWLIGHRSEKSKIAYEKRNAQAVAAEKALEKKRALEEAQSKALHELMMKREQSDAQPSPTPTAATRKSRGYASSAAKGDDSE